MKQSFADQIKAARSANTPLLAIETADNNAAIQRIAAALSDKTPLIQWDVVRGWTPVGGESGWRCRYEQVRQR